MKLNLGCGGEHKKGYLNIDAFDDTIADKIMSAINLELDDNSVEEILMSQLIEHFGIARTIFALSECFRVLVPSGKLIIETPDINTSFKIYLDGEREDRKNILPWIYGVDIPGMQHRFCFPEDLLEEELGKIGFTSIKKEYLKFDEYQPILRVECEKPEKIEAFQAITKYRKKLLESNEIELDNQITALEKNDLIEYFNNELNRFSETKNENIFEEMLINGSVQSPKMTCEFFNIVMENNLLSNENGTKYIQILKKLNRINFQKVLLNKLINVENYEGKQEELFDLVCNHGKNIVKELLIHPDVKIEELIQPSHESLFSDLKIDFFSEKIVMLEANKIFQKGVKEFNLSRYDEAVNYFEKSFRLFRDQILIYWNLGRLHKLKNNNDIAKSYYENALNLLDLIEYKDGKNLEEKIKHEMNSNDAEHFNKSIISLSQIL